MDLRMTTSDPATIQRLMEADVTRLKNELNYRLLMESELTGDVLWVEKITLTKVEPPVRGHSRLFTLLRAFAGKLAGFKNKSFQERR